MLKKGSENKVKPNKIIKMKEDNFPTREKVQRGYEEEKRRTRIIVDEKIIKL